MMMNAEIAKEMIRSRSQMPRPVPTRKGATTTSGAGATGTPKATCNSPAELCKEGPESGNVSGMRALLYTESDRRAPGCLRDFLLCASGPDRGDRLQYLHRGTLMTRGLLSNQFVYRILTLVF